MGFCLLDIDRSPSVENPSGGASVAYFFYSSLRYFENILVQAFDEGRDSLQPLCLGIFSNGFVFEEMQFDWRPALLPSNFAARSSYFASAISQSLPATNTGGAVSSIHGRRWPMLCGLLVRHMLWLSTIISANTNVIWHWNCFCSCHGKTDECDAGGGALKRAVDVRVFSPGLFR